MILVVYLLNLNCTSSAYNGINPDPYQRLVITLLYHEIRDAVEDYYGENVRGFDLYNARITKLESAGGWAKFHVTVEVDTFTGPHNPPGAKEKLTFYIVLGKKPVLTDYEHEAI